MSQDQNRLLLELERRMREINREIINPEFQALTLEGLRPVLRLVASARRRYLQTLLRLGTAVEAGQPEDRQLDELARRRREYEELTTAAQALEAAIQRGYLDVEPNGR